MLTIVFDLDGTLVDTAPDLIDTLNFTLTKHDLPTVPYDEARPMIGGGARSMIERALAAARGAILRRPLWTSFTPVSSPTTRNISPTARGRSRT